MCERSANDKTLAISKKVHILQALDLGNYEVTGGPGSKDHDPNPTAKHNDGGGNKRTFLSFTSSVRSTTVWINRSTFFC